MFQVLAASCVTVGEWLVVKLQSLVEVGFRMATGSVEALRPTGLALQVQCILSASPSNKLRQAPLPARHHFECSVRPLPSPFSLCSHRIGNFMLYHLPA